VSATIAAADVDAPSRAPLIDIVVPVHNEAHVLASSVQRLRSYLQDDFPFTWRITIVDNASTDDTMATARALAALHGDVRAVHLDRKGRGLALRTAWTHSDAAVVAYMDVDLSTDLSALLPLVAPLVTGHSDITIGSRLARGARTVRGPRRELISRTYNRILRLVFHNGFRDAQCGFKALRTDVAHQLLPHVEDQTWFFDTELLLVAEHNGLRIVEVPVDWVDDPDSRVRIARTACDDLRGVARVAARFWTGRGRIALGDVHRPPAPPGTGGELVTFAAVGIVSTVVALGIWLALRDTVGSVGANAIALTVTVVANTAANRRWTFGHIGARGRLVSWRRAAVVHLASLVLTSGALVAAQVIDPGRLSSELALLLIANLASTALRFVLMPAFVFRGDGAS
jgi:putative flippase GtrA